jgi:hypothetical protein
MADSNFTDRRRDRGVSNAAVMVMVVVMVHSSAAQAGAEANNPQPLLMEVAQREDSVTTGKDDSTSVSGSEASQVMPTSCCSYDG